MKATFDDIANNSMKNKMNWDGRSSAGFGPRRRGHARRVRSTTVLCVRRGDSVVMAADGQVTLGASVMKHSAKKIRRLYQDKVLAGFAGSTRGRVLALRAV